MVILALKMLTETSTEGKIYPVLHNQQLRNLATSFINTTDSEIEIIQFR